MYHAKNTGKNDVDGVSRQGSHRQPGAAATGKRVAPRAGASGIRAALSARGQHERESGGAGGSADLAASDLRQHLAEAVHPHRRGDRTHHRYRIVGHPAGLSGSGELAQGRSSRGADFGQRVGAAVRAARFSGHRGRRAGAEQAAARLPGTGADRKLHHEGSPASRPPA